MSHTSINRVGTDHTIWMKGLGFYKDEIGIMDTRLTEVAKKNNSFEARQGIEHFQNQFLVQQKNISDLKHEVNNYVKKLGNDAQQHSGQIHESLIPEHNILQGKYENFEMVMNGLRHEFNEYVAKWM